MLNSVSKTDLKFVTANSLIGLPKNQQSSFFEDTEGVGKLKELRNRFFGASNSERVGLKDEFKELQKKMLLRLIDLKGEECSIFYLKLPDALPLTFRILMVTQPPIDSLFVINI